MRIPCKQLSSLSQYRLFKAKPSCEREFLRRSIQEKGVLVPVIADETLAVLDGHDRLDLCLELGKDDIPVEIVHGLTEEQKRDLILELGSLHRSLTISDRKELARNELLYRQGNITDKALGELVGLSDKTVKGVRDKLVGSSEIPNLSVRLDKNGVSQPARKRRLAKAPSLDEPKAKVEARDKGEEEGQQEAFGLDESLDEPSGLPGVTRADIEEIVGKDDSSPPEPEAARPTHIYRGCDHLRLESASRLTCLDGNGHVITWVVQGNTLADQLKEALDQWEGK
jgi:ParB-like chromosome segregation protein Spo0J